MLIIQYNNMKVFTTNYITTAIIGFLTLFCSSSQTLMFNFKTFKQPTGFKL